MSTHNPFNPPKPAALLTVYFDGACPLCRREIGFYQRRSAQAGIDWIDVSQPAVLPPSLTADAAMARFHVADAAGCLYDGGEAFAMLWQHIPGFKWAGSFLRLPGVRHCVNFLYDRFLTIRPWLQSRTRAVCDEGMGR